MQDGITLGSAGYDGSNTSYESYIRAGWLMGKITSSGLWVPCKRTKTNGAGSATPVALKGRKGPHRSAVTGRIRRGGAEGGDSEAGRGAFSGCEPIGRG
jgi:hypothetical protein